MDFFAVLNMLCKVVAASLYPKNKNKNPPKPEKYFFIAPNSDGLKK